MGGMREIVNLESLNHLFAVLAIVLPLMGLIVGVGWGTGRGQARQGAVMGMCVGALGTLNWLLWLAYNAITSRLGLDTTRNVVVNLAFFVVAGLALGMGIGMLQYRFQPVPAAQKEAEVTTEQEIAE